jgi:hypothetical protein
MSESSAPVEPFVIVSMTAGLSAANVPVLYAWLQSDTVRDARTRPTKLALGTDIAAALDNPAVLRVDADAADGELYPTGERISPTDDLVFPVDRAYSPPPPPDAVWLLRQVPPGQPGQLPAPIARNPENGEEIDARRESADESDTGGETMRDELAATNRAVDPIRSDEDDKYVRINLARWRTIPAGERPLIIHAVIEDALARLDAWRERRKGAAE